MADTSKLVLSLEVTDNGVVRVVRQLREEIALLNNEVREADGSVSRLGNELREATGDFRRAESSAEALNRQLNQMSGRGARAASSLRAASQATATLGNNGAVSRISNIGSSIGSLVTLIRNGLVNSVTAARGALSALGRAFRNVGMAVVYLNQGFQLLSSALRTVWRGFQDVTDSGGKFQQHLANVSTLYKGYIETAEAVQGFRKEIMGMLGDLPVSANDLGASAYEIVSAGIVDTARAFKILETSAKLGVAGLGSTEEAVDLLTSAVNAYGFSVEEVDKVSNSFFLTVLWGKAKIQELNENFGKVAPIAATAGVKINELNAATSALTQGGMKARDAHIYLRQAINAFLKPSAAMRDALVLIKNAGDRNVEGYQKMATASGKTAIETYGLVGSMIRLREVLDNDESAFAKALSRVQALAAGLSLTGNMYESFLKIFEDMENDVDALNEAYDKAGNTWPRAVERLSSAFDKVKISLFDSFAKFGPPIIYAIRDAFLELSDYFESQEWTDLMYEFATDTLPVLVDGFLYFAEVTANLIPMLVKMQVILSSLQIGAAFGAINPYLGLVAGAGAAIYGLSKASQFDTAIEPVLNGLSSLREKAAKILKSATNDMKMYSENAKRYMGHLAETMEEFSRTGGLDPNGQSSLDGGGMSLIIDQSVIQTQEDFGQSMVRNSEIAERLRLDLVDVARSGGHLSDEAIRYAQQAGILSHELGGMAAAFRLLGDAAEETSDKLEAYDKVLKAISEQHETAIDILETKAETAVGNLRELLSKDNVDLSSGEVKTALTVAVDAETAAIERNILAKEALAQEAFATYEQNKDNKDQDFVRQLKEKADLKAAELEQAHAVAKRVTEAQKIFDRENESRRKTYVRDEKADVRELTKEYNTLNDAKKGYASSIVDLRKQELENLIAAKAADEELLAKAWEVDQATRSKLAVEAEILQTKIDQIKATGDLSEMDRLAVGALEAQIDTINASVDVANDATNKITQKISDSYEKVTFDISRMWRDSMSDILESVATGTRKMSDVWKGLKDNMRKYMFEAFDAIIFGKKRKLDDPLAQNLDGIGDLFGATAAQGANSFGGLFGYIAKGFGNLFQGRSWGDFGTNPRIAVPGPNIPTTNVSSGTSSSWFSQLFNGGGSDGDSGGGLFGGLFGGAGDFFSGIFGGGGSSGGGFFSNIFSSISNGFSSLTSKIGSFFGSGSSSLLNTGFSSGFLNGGLSLAGGSAGNSLFSSGFLNGGLSVGGPGSFLGTNNGLSVAAGSSGTQGTSLLSSGLGLAGGLSAVIGIAGMIAEGIIGDKLYQSKTEAKITEYGSMVPIFGGFAYAGPLINKLFVNPVVNALGERNNGVFWHLLMTVFNPLGIFLQDRNSERDYLRRGARKTLGPIIAADYPELFNRKDGVKRIMPNESDTMSQRLAAGGSVRLDSQILALLYLGGLGSSPLDKGNKKRPNINNSSWLGSYNTVAGQIEGMFEDFPDMAEDFAQSLYRGLSGSIARGVDIIQKAMVRVISVSRRRYDDFRDTEKDAYERLTGQKGPAWESHFGDVGGEGVPLMPTFQEAIKRFLEMVLDVAPRAVREAIPKLVDDEFERVALTREKDSIRDQKDHGLGTVSGEQIQRLMEIQNDAFIMLAEAMNNVARKIEEDALTNRQARKELSIAVRETLAEKTREELSAAFFGSRSMDNLLAPFLTTLERGTKAILDADSEEDADTALSALMSGLSNDILLIQQNIHKLVPIMRQYNELITDVTIALTMFSDVVDNAKAAIKELDIMIAALEDDPDKSADMVIKNANKSFKEQLRKFNKEAGFELFEKDGDLISRSKQDIRDIIDALTDKQLKQMPTLLSEMANRIAENAKAQIEALEATLARAQAWANLFDPTQDGLLAIRQYGRPAGETAEAVFEASKARVDELIDDFRNGTNEERLFAAQQLLQAGPELLNQAIQAGILPGSTQFELLRGSLVAVLQDAQRKAFKAEQEVKDIQDKIREIEEKSLDQLKEIKRVMKETRNEARTRTDVMEDIEDNTGPTGPVKTQIDVATRTYDILNRGITVGWGKSKFDNFGPATGEEYLPPGGQAFKYEVPDTGSFESEPPPAYRYNTGSGDGGDAKGLSVEVPVVYRVEEPEVSDTERLRRFEDDLVRALSNRKLRRKLTNMLNSGFSSSVTKTASSSSGVY